MVEDNVLFVKCNLVVYLLGEYIRRKMKGEILKLKC